MRSRSWSKDELLWRQILAVLAQAGRYDLVEQLEQSRRRGRRLNPGIAYRQFDRLWESYRRRHEGTDEELTDEELLCGFFRAHGPQIKRLGLKIGQKINSLGSTRNAASRGKRVRAQVKSRRQSSSQFMQHAFGRQDRRTIRLGLGRHKQTVDRATAEYLLDQAKKVLSGEEPTALF
jgi:hypothetical protein